MTRTGATILLVDDDPLMRRSLAWSLTQAGFRTVDAPDAETALESAHLSPPDLILLDIGLPGMDGLEALRRLRYAGSTAEVPVIFVTARRRELEQVLGLELGADDYITKPFDPDVLIARVRAVLRRSHRIDAMPAEELVAGDIVIDLPGHRVRAAGRDVELSPREFDLLVALARAAGRVLSVDELLQRVWGEGYAGEPQIVYVHMRRLREKLEEAPNRPRRILTVRGVGYRLNLQDAPP